MGASRTEAAIARPLFPRIVAAVAFSAGIVALAVWMLKPVPAVEPGLVARFVHTLSQNQTFRGTGRPMVAISPDGRHFVYNANDGLYLRSMDGLSARVIPGTEANLTTPFFAPDGQSLGFFADGELKKIPVAGGTAVTLAKATNPFGVSWGADNTIVFGQPEGILRSPQTGERRPYSSRPRKANRSMVRRCRQADSGSSSR